MDQQPQNVLIPGAIVIAGLLIAGAVFMTNRDLPASPAAVADTNAPLYSMRPVSTDSDHLLGSPDAKIIIVEYSDLECPFCKSFHNTMKQVMETYGKDGSVAWVYRHFPLTTIHPKAQKEAEASECAAELGGTLGFWEYVDRVFELTPSNNNLDPALLPKIAEDVGLDRADFEACLSSGKHRERVTKDRDNAIGIGAQGTPFSVMLSKDGAARPIEGAVPFDSLKTIIDGALAQ
ncbi:MAG: thioredoxin domain-containing protein [Parcubacteria group bacterium]|nr:thioredoxin domain-containing protein [Parcubacteria group bacterium]